jgi:mannose-6-phosphate isomerase-like protein (cupin superfamily)
MKNHIIKWFQILTIVIGLTAAVLTKAATNLNEQQYLFKKIYQPSSILNIRIPPAGKYSAGYPLKFKVKYNQVVIVHGTPSLPVVVGTTLRQAIYSSGSNTNTLVFQLKPLQGDQDIDGIELLNIILLEATEKIINRAGINAKLELPSVDMSRVLVDAGASPPDFSCQADTINGDTPPVTASPALKSEILSDLILQIGNGIYRRALVIKTTRMQGTRAYIHDHQYSGTTFVLKGEVTIFMKGSEPKKLLAGEAYFMPSGHSMAAANIGNEEAIMIDSFILPIDGKSWRVLELGYTDCGKEILEDL